jgi:LAO/AO transport system kinase
MIVINKADLEPKLAERSAREYRAALHILEPAHPDWTPPVITVSGLRGEGVDKLWAQVQRHREVMQANGARAARRSDQNARWMWAMVRERLDQAFRDSPAVAKLAPQLETAVRSGRTPASAAADALLSAYLKPK